MFATLILTDEIRKIINSQLKKINTSWDLGLIDIAFNSDKVDVSQFEISEIERNKIMWEDIAKLSINLMLDYDYYKQFFFKSRYTEKEYSGRLLNLGLVFENDYWKSVCEPDIKDVQTNIFMYLKYRIIFEKMRDLGNEDGGLLGNNDFMKEETNIKKWKCGGCGLLNEYSVMNCVVCFGLYKDCKWTCGRCNNENSGGDNLCGSCNERNANIAVLEGDNQDNTGGSGGTAHKQTHIPADEWRCTHTGCNTRQSYKYIVCQLCDSSRCVSGEWMCAKCKVIIKCDIDKCHLCDEWNDNFTKKLCQNCGTNRVPLTEVQCGDCARNINMAWTCEYSKCGITNRGRDEYCSKCFFWRHNTYGRGDECKQRWYFGMVNRGWICHKCTTFNKLNKTECSKYICKEFRYAMISTEVGNKDDTEEDTKASYESVSVTGDSGNKFEMMDTDKYESIPVDEWRCTKCTMRHSFEYAICQFCDRSRWGYGEWRCAQCKIMNKSDNEKCHKCDAWNDNLTKKLCEYCNTNRVTWPNVLCDECKRNINMPWQCGFSRCGYDNKGTVEYCVKCKFWRHNTYGRGDECRQQDIDYNNVKCWWICVKCNTYNKLHREHCSNKDCIGTRYAKIVCDHCHYYNDHRSTQCMNGCGKF